MKGNDANGTFIYQTDQVPVHRWRQVMEICQAYEKCLLDGQTTPAEDFAFQHPSIPKELLLPELERVRGECIEEASTPTQIEPFEYPQSERYQILDEIRSGGMGQVFRAFDRACGRLVALKKIRKEFAHDPRARRRFLAEVELTADLEHPGVIPIYDQSVDSAGREFYVMRLICGEGSVLSQATELHVHLIKFELKANRNDTAEEHFQLAIGHALELKALPRPSEGSLLSIKQQMENALRFAQELGNQDLKDDWSKKILQEGLLPAS